MTTVAIESNKLVVVVGNDRWNAFGDHSNPHVVWLYSLLVEIGGVNESVTPGVYHFDAYILGSESTVITMDPVPDL